jgi:hypothetical protein
MLLFKVDQKRAILIGKCAQIQHMMLNKICPKKERKSIPYSFDTIINLFPFLFIN